jgi:hypothetical protein
MPSFRCSPLPLAMLLMLGPGCRTVHHVPLESGAYVMDELNSPPKLHGVTLDLDLNAGEATVADGVTNQTFTLTRVPDREQWRGGCGTMSGHSMLEPVRLSPTKFNLVSQDWEFDTIHADCGGGSVRMTQKASADDRWIFRKR